MYGLIFQGGKGRTYRRGAAGSRGFTLVELLVVVAIIALLVSILLPTLGKAKEQARTVMCMSNIRGLGVSFSFYTTENNNWLPAGCGIGGDAPTWDFILQPYYDVFGLLQCPSDRLVRRWDYYGVLKENRHPRSYAINRDVTWMGPSVWDPDCWPFQVRKVSEVTDPSDTILLGEMWEAAYYSSVGWLPGMYSEYYGCGIFYEKAENPNRQATMDVHRNKDMANYLFCDGHVMPVQVNDKQLVAPDYYYWKFSK